MPSTHSKPPTEALADIHYNIQLATKFAEGLSYEGEDVLEQILWQTLKHALEPLKATIEEELRRLEGG